MKKALKSGIKVSISHSKIRAFRWDFARCGTMSVEKYFEEKLISQNIQFNKLSESSYEVQTDNGFRQVSLSNIERAFLTSNEKTIVDDFIDNILKPNQSLPEWEVLKESIFPSLQNAEQSDLNDILYKELSDGAIVVLTYYNEAAGQVRWLSESDLSSESITLELAWRQAFSNLDEIMKTTEVSFTDVNGQLLGMIQAYEPYKASLLLSKELKNKVIDQLEWPIYAVAPTRGFVYLFSKESQLINRVGQTVVAEYKSSPYPISTEVWELTDDGQKSIGKYPAD